MEPDIEGELQKLRDEVAQKNLKVVKLKGLLTRSMRSDKRREQQVEGLTNDISDLERRIEGFNRESEFKSRESAEQATRIGELEAELAELMNRLHSGAGSEAAQKRGERMKQMLDRSNSLYADLQTKYQRTIRDLDTERAKRSRLPRAETVIVISDDECVVLNDDGTYAMADASTRPPGARVIDARRRKAVVKEPAEVGQTKFKGYLRGVVLEFFLGDSATQLQLVPVILQLLECTPVQIQAAQRGYAEGRQIIAKAASAFGL